MFGVLAADGGIKLNAKEMALAYGIGALIFWTVLSYFAGAAALGAALTFGAMIYTVHWIPNRMTNFLNDVPGVTTGMIDGIKQYTLNGVVPILTVISLVFGIQSIVRSVQRRRRERAEADRLQREQEAAVQAQRMPEPVAAYPVAGGEYQPDARFGGNFGNSNYDDLFEEEPAPFSPRNQADEQTAQFAPATTPTQYSDERDDAYEEQTEGADETMLVPTDSDETVMVPTDPTVADGDETVVAAPPQNEATEVAPSEDDGAEDEGAEEAATQPVPVPEPEASKPVAPRVAGGQQAATAPEAAAESTPSAPSQAEDGGEATQPMPETPKPPAPQASAEAAQPVAEVAKPAASQPWVGEATQAVPVAPRPAAPQAGMQRKEEVGQQYRERMDPPDVDDTGEFFVGSFENPPEQAGPTMQLPGHFRAAGN